VGIQMAVNRNPEPETPVAVPLECAASTPRVPVE
jgi:hypothetical protein